MDASRIASPQYSILRWLKERFAAIHTTNSNIPYKMAEGQILIASVYFSHASLKWFSRQKSHPSLLPANNLLPSVFNSSATASILISTDIYVPVYKINKKLLLTNKQEILNKG